MNCHVNLTSAEFRFHDRFNLKFEGNFSPAILRRNESLLIEVAEKFLFVSSVNGINIELVGNPTADIALS